MSPLDDFELWFITGSVDLYGPESLKQVAANATEIARFLDSLDSIPVRIVPKSVVASPTEIRAVMLEANGNEKCIGIVAWMHTFSPAKMWIAGLNALQKPLLHLHTQFNQDLPWATIDMAFMNLNQSAHGDREFAFIETRMGIPRKTVVGHWRSQHVHRQVALWSRAAAGWHEAQNLKVARFGDNMRYVAVTEGDKVEAEIQLGVSVNTFGVNDLVEAVRRAPESDVKKVVAAYEDLYELAPNLAARGDRRDSLVEQARIEVGLRSLLVAGGFRAFTDTFEDLGELRQLPGLAAQRLMSEGYGFGAEGDWKSASLLRIMKVMTQGLAGGCSFMEDYTYHLAPNQEKILGAHMLELCPSIAAARPRAEVHPLSLGNREDPVRLVFDAAPGPAIVSAWLDLGERFRFVCNEIDVVPPDAELPMLPTARAIWKPKPDLVTSAECWMTAGGPHHTIFSSAATVELLEAFTEIARMELLIIDAKTRMREFMREIRLNQAYYHLARGL
jgi:L-arabinose isomerase